MKKQFNLANAILTTHLCFAASLCAQRIAPLTSLSATTASRSADQQRADEAQRQIDRNPKRAQGYNELALACIRLSRDTGNPAYLVQADAAIQKARSFAPDDFQLAKANAALLLQSNDYSKALEVAKDLNKKVPDDVTVYGYVAEADIALGKYADADSSVQWMINMRPNNVAGLILGAELRELYGDGSGAVDFLNQAYSETPQVDPEQQVYIANKIAAVDLASGQIDAAAQVLAGAEALGTQSPETTKLLARVRLEQKKPAEAASLLQALLLRQQAVHASQAETLYLLAETQRQATQPAATETFARFAATAATESGQPSNDNVDLILYYASRPEKKADALHLAQQRVAQRQDVWTLDAYASALYANEEYVEADVQIQRALSVGIHSAQVFDHAGQIALKRSKPDGAAQNFAAAMQADPSSIFALDARRQIGNRTQITAAISAVPQIQAVNPDEPKPAAPVVVSVAETKDDGGIPTTLLIPKPTGTDRIIRKMQAQVTAHPKDPAAYSGLGAAFFQRARETGDVEDYQLAEQALTKSLDMVSTDLSATAPLESMAEVCMGEHRFTDALDYAQKALALGSGDVSAFAIVGDAYADMGEYEKASIAYSRLQPSSTGPLEAREAYAQQTRTAYLKFIAGDVDGAIAEMQSAVDEGVQAHLPSENLAWLYFELGEFSYQAGKIPAAADAYLTALTVYPGDYRALAGLGKVRASQGKYKEAITLYQSAIAVVPMPIYIAELGDVYKKTGDSADAEKQYKLVQYIGLLGHINQVLHNRDLALFYADHDRNLEESLALARKEFEVRSDIYTWDALAWSLYKNGKLAEAKDAMAHASRLGTKDPMLLFHAGMISARLGDQAQAVTQLREALSINPQFSVLYAPAARQQLDSMSPQSTLASIVSSSKTSQQKAINVQ